MDRLRHFAAIFVLLVFSGCSSTTTGVVVDPNAPITSQDLQNDVGSGTTGSNGIEFASDTFALGDLTETELTVKMIWFKRNWAQNTVTVGIGDETVTLDADFFTDAFPGSEFTLDGTAYAIDPGESAVGDTQIGNNLPIWGIKGANGRRADAQIYKISTSRLQEFAFYILGSETDPATVSAQFGTANYVGDFETQGAATEPDGSWSEWSSSIRGDIFLAVNFDTGQVSGSFDGTYQFLNDGYLVGTVDGTIAPGDINGNGFHSTMTLGTLNPDTPALALTVVDTEGLIGGSFYGSDIGYLSGLIHMDATLRKLDGSEFYYLGVGNFASELDPD